MIAILQYLLRLSVGLTCVYLFYLVLLKKFTFYRWNRAYFWAYSGLCLILPIIDISKLFKHSLAPSTLSFPDALISGIPQVAIQSSSTPAPSSAFNFTTILGFLLITGMIVMALRLAGALVSIYRLKQKSSVLARKPGYTIYQVDAAITPFSFLGSIFLNKVKHDGNQLEKILAHEQVHVLQRHTLDNLWVELLVIVNWFNPFVWLLRNAVKENLEYIADDQVLRGGINKQQYQYLLLQVSGIQQPGPVNAFNLSSLKNRIKMMNKTKTARVQLLKFIFVLPLIIVLLFSFRAVTNRSQGDIQFYGSILDATNNQPMEDVKVTDHVNHIDVTTDKHGYYSFSFDNEKAVKYPLHLLIQKEGFKPANIGIKNFKGKDGVLNTLFMANAGLQPSGNDKPTSTILIGAAKGTQQYLNLQKTMGRFTMDAPATSHLEIAGIVFDKVSNEAISDASIQDQENKIIGHTDKKGFYTMQIHEKDIVGFKYQLKFIKQGYQDFQFAFSLDPAKQRQVHHTYLLANIGMAKLPFQQEGPYPSSYSTGKDTKVTYKDALAAMDFKAQNDAIAQKVKATGKAIVQVGQDLWVISQNTTSRYTMPEHLTIRVDGKPMSLSEASKKLLPNNIKTVDMENGQDLVLTTNN